MRIVLGAFVALLIVLGLPGAVRAQAPAQSQASAQGQALGQAPLRDRVLIVVDRSSVAAQGAAKAWAERMLLTQARRYQVSVMSFRDGVAGAVQGLTVFPSDRRLLSQALAPAEPQRIRFDPEPFLDGLTIDAELSRVALVLMVVGGAPGSLEKVPDPAFLDNPRYKMLAQTYLEWVRAQATVPELLDYFVPFYARHQQMLMDRHAAALTPALAGRVVVWDVSGGKGEGVFRPWLRPLQGSYVARTVGDEGQTSAAISVVQDVAAPLLGMVVPSGASGFGPWVLAFLCALVAAGGGAWLWHKWPRSPLSRPDFSLTLPVRKKRLRVKAEPVIVAADLQPAPIQPIIVAPVSIEPSLEWPAAPPVSSPEPAPIPEPVPIPVSDPVPDPVTAPVPQLAPPRPIIFESLIPPGRLRVMWQDAHGQPGQGDGLTLTLTDMRFAWAGVVPAYLTRIESAALGVVIDVVRADVTVGDDGTATATFIEFGNPLDDRMALIDLVIGLEEV